MMTYPDKVERHRVTGGNDASTEHARCGPTSQHHVARGARPAPPKWVSRAGVQSDDRDIFSGK